MTHDLNQSRGQQDNSAPGVHIVGSLALQNTFLADFLTREAGVRTTVWNRIEPYLEHAHNAPRRTRLLLLDTHGLRTDQIKNTLGRCTDHEVTAYIALFNLPAGRDLEKKVVPLGIRGVFYDQDPLTQFTKGVSAILNNELWVSRSVMAEIIMEKENPQRHKEKHASGLTAREVEILELITIGSSNEAIADKLCISRNTVKTHIYNIFKKIDVPNRLQAALWAVKNR